MTPCPKRPRNALETAVSLSPGLNRASECMAEIIAQLFPFARVDRPRLVVTSFGNATKIFHRVRNQNCSYLEEERPN